MSETKENVNKLIDDLSRVFTGALGVAQGARSEAENAVKARLDRFINEQGFVSREEFDAVAEMAANARAEVATLRAEFEALKAAQNGGDDA